MKDHQNLTKSKYRFQQFLNVLGLILALVANGLAVFLPLNGKTTKQLSDQYANLFVPAGLTFSIWSVIYLLLILFVIYQLGVFSTKDKKHEAVEAVDKMGWLFLVSCLANAGWIFAWHYEALTLSVAVMLVMLLTLIAINIKFGIFTYGQGWRHQLFVQAPFGIYLGWISIATIANITAVLVNYHWGGWGISEISWTIIMIVIGALVALIMVIKKDNFYFALVVIWAYYGIILKRHEAGVADQKPIIVACVIAMILIGVMSIWKIIDARRKDRHRIQHGGATAV